VTVGATAAPALPHIGLGYRTVTSGWPSSTSKDHHPNISKPSAPRTTRTASHSGQNKKTKSQRRATMPWPWADARPAPAPPPSRLIMNPWVMNNSRLRFQLSVTQRGRTPARRQPPPPPPPPTTPPPPPPPPAVYKLTPTCAVGPISWGPCCSARPLPPRAWAALAFPERETHGKENKRAVVSVSVP